MEKKIVNQKEYLKKYLSFGDDDDKKKKRKKKHKTGAKTVKIIDDDLELKNVTCTEENEFDILLEGEDAPQIAGIIDERGPVDFTDKTRWKIINDDEGSDSAVNRTTNKESRDRSSRGKEKTGKEEVKMNKQRDTERSNKLSKAVNGVGQAPIMRDKLGRKRNLEAEAAEERERKMQQREIDEKYAKWGKGLKQVEDHEEKLKNDLYEMSKPLARYADDADLDKRMREQERDGDPMLKYIRQKQIKEGKRKPDPPQYQGSYAPNRFGIKPGHRWDGVNRSNGYEKKWFEAQNSKVARQEEAYKWSTADM